MSNKVYVDTDGRKYHRKLVENSRRGWCAFKNQDLIYRCEFLPDGHFSERCTTKSGKYYIFIEVQKS
jgi:hypothetical protein